MTGDLPVLLWFLLMIFRGREGEAEFLCRRRADGEGAMEMGTLGDCLALEQLAFAEPTLEERSSPLEVAWSMSLTI